MLNSKLPQLFNRIDQAEYVLCMKLNKYSSKISVKTYFSVVSRLGDGIFWYVLMLALPLVEGKAGLEASFTMLFGGIVCTILYKSLKNVLVRERPFISFPVIQVGTPPLDRYSFPSGHTLHAVSFTVMLYAFYPILAIIVLPFTVSVMLSRVILGLHYPSDVTAGALIGTVIAFLFVYLNNEYQLFSLMAASILA